MRISLLFALAAFAVALSPVACASPTEDDPVSSPSAEGDADDELKSLALTDADNGKTVTLTAGKSILVKLSSNPTTGFKWAVASTDRTFGYPASDVFVPSGAGAVGSGGLQRFTWKTSSPLNMVGSHTVKLEYKRSWEKNVPAAQVFTFTVKIVDAPATNACVSAGGACVGLAPSSCAAGHWADAMTHSCGAGLGVGCCVP